MTTKPDGAFSQLKTFLADGRGLAMVNYALLFFMVMTIGATGILALLIATYAEHKAPDWIRSHYQLQIRTFWIGILPAILLYFIGEHLLRVLHAGPMTMFIVVMPVLAWIASRCAMGFNHLLNSRPYPNPRTWIV